jgi:hypothetical protein
MDDIRNAYNSLVGKFKGKGPLGNLAADGRIILEWVLGKLVGKAWIGCIWLRIQTRGEPLCTREFHKRRRIS